MTLADCVGVRLPSRRWLGHGLREAASSSVEMASGGLFKADVRRGQDRSLFCIAGTIFNVAQATDRLSQFCYFPSAFSCDVRVSVA
jgi:hypothetical protein